MYSAIHRDNPSAFKSIILLYTFTGIISGITGAFFTYFFYTIAGARNTLLYLNVGAIASFIMLKFYNYIINKIKTINGVLVFSHIMYFIADVMVLAPFFFPRYAKLFIFLNGFIAASLFIMYQTNLDTYAMKLYNFSNRAKITSLSVITVNFAGFVMLFMIKFMPQNPVFIVSITEIIRFTFIATILLLPKIEKEKSVGQLHAHFLDGKLLYVFIGIAFLQIGLRLTASMKSPVIKEVLGAGAIPTMNALTLLTTIILFFTLMRYTTEYGKIILRTSALSILFGAIYFVSKSNALSYAAIVAMTPAFINLIIMSVRHYAIKKVPKSQTKDVLYTVNLVSYIARAIIAVFTAFIVVGAITYFDIGIISVLASIIFIVMSKFQT